MKNDKISQEAERKRSYMERIDKIIASQGQYSRKEVKALIAKGRVAVDGKTVKSSSDKADPAASQIAIDGKTLEFKRNIYIMLILLLQIHSTGLLSL